MKEVSYSIPAGRPAGCGWPTGRARPVSTGEDIRRERRGGVPIVARFSSQVSMETSFMLCATASASPRASLSFFSSSSLIFALNISQRTGSGRVTYCSSSTLSQWRRQPFSHSPPPRHVHQRGEERRGERERENVGNRGRNRKMALCN